MRQIDFKCAAGHEQRITTNLPVDEAHDFAVLIAGGTLRSLGTVVPGLKCQCRDAKDVPCGAEIAFTIRDVARPS